MKGHGAVLLPTGTRHSGQATRTAGAGFAAPGRCPSGGRDYLVEGVAARLASSPSLLLWAQRMMDGNMVGRGAFMWFWAIFAVVVLVALRCRAACGGLRYERLR